MKTANLLGISSDTIAVLFDILNDEGYSNFDLYPNMENIVTPFLPLNEISYNIKSINDKPKENFFFGVASPKNKNAVFNYFFNNHKINKEKYIQVIHRTAYVAKSSILESGVLVEPNVTISSQSSIGFGVFIKRGAQIGHHNIIGNFSDINPGVVISGKVTIGENCIIGSGAIIKDNITIGENSIIGVGSVVTKNIPANSIAFGNPCKVIRENI